MSAQSKKSSKHLALMRGINVGGKNILPMKELAKIFTTAGGENVRTFIQSGNVIFDAAPNVAVKIAEQVHAQIAKRFGFQVPVVLRTQQELEDAIANNAFLKAGASDEFLHALFLADLPTVEQIAKLDLQRSPPDEFIVLGREIYLKLPNGAARSKLTNAYFDSKLATVTTGRNWRTITKLLELMKA